MTAAAVESLHRATIRCPDGLTVTSLLAPVKTVKERSLKILTGLTHSDEEELPLKGLKLFVGEKYTCLPGCAFSY